MEEILLIACAFLLLPVIAIAVAIAAINRSNALKDELERLRLRLDGMEQADTVRRFAEARRQSSEAARGQPSGAAEPAGEREPEPPAVEPEPTVSRPEPLDVHGLEEQETTAPADGTPDSAAGEIPTTDAEPQEAIADDATPACHPPSWMVAKLKTPWGAKAEAVTPAAAARLESSEVEGSQDKVGIEEKLGSRVFVWIGAIAMALAGGFLVKYTVDENLLTERVRIIIGAAFGLALLGTGEWMSSRSKRIAEGLSAAGIFVLFATLFSAVNLYHLISPLTGFVLMAVVAALAVVLSLRRGPFVALLGLVGGFMTPVLVDVGEPDPALFGYLLLLELGLLAVTRRRGWAILAGLTLIGGMTWVGAWMAMWYLPAHTTWLGSFLLATVAAFAVAGRLGQADEAWGKAETGPTLTWGVTLCGLFALCILVGRGSFETQEWVFFGLLCAGCLVLARLDMKLEGLAWLASAAGLALLIAWHVDAGAKPPQTRFGLTILAIGLLHAGGAYACLWGSSRPNRWVALFGVSTLAYLLVGYFCMESAPPGLPWWVICVILAAIHTVAAIPVYRRRDRSGEWELALACAAVSVTVLASLAAPVELERAWISVAWALQIPALALIDWRLRIPVLRILARLVAAGVVIRLMFNPQIVHYDIGTHLLWNWLLYGYGIPVLALAAGAWLFKPSEDENLVDSLGGGAIALGFALITLLIRQGFHPGEIGCIEFPLNECATFAVAWFAYAWGLLLAARRWPRRCIVQGGGMVAIVALVEAALALGLFRNPLWTHASLGALPVLNMLLYVYGLPAVLTFLAAWELMRHDKEQQQIARILTGVGLGLMMVLVTLEVRQGFQGEFLDKRAVTNIESYTYPIAWLAVGLACLIACRRWPRKWITWFGGSVAGAGLAATVIVQVGARNPLWTSYAVGAWPVLNMLLYLYAVPAILILLAARELLRQNWRDEARVFGATAITLLFVLVSLEVRQYYQGTYLNAPFATDAETYAYSAAWVLFGALLLVLGITTRGIVLRYASLIVMLLAMGKVFLYDTRNLEDLYRVFSLFGLGLTSLTLAYLYQRFVFRKMD